MSLTWTVSNEGEGRTLETNWEDEIYLSTDSVLDENDIFLGRQARNGVLNSGDSYSVTRDVTLPIGVSGDFFFIVRTDGRNQVFEQVFENNNTGFDATATRINLTPPPDLEIDFVDVC